MPTPGKRWRLVTISTYASWLPGDERGFRAKRHKIHSSGDYRGRPPRGEHAGLHHYAKRISGRPVIIPRRCRAVVGEAILLKLEKLGHRVLSISVSGMHAPVLVELPDDLRVIRHVVGQCKTVASHAVREVLPGRVWAAPETSSRWTRASTSSTRTAIRSNRSTRGCGATSAGW